MAEEPILRFTEVRLEPVGTYTHEKNEDWFSTVERSTAVIVEFSMYAVPVAASNCREPDPCTKFELFTDRPVAVPPTAHVPLSVIPSIWFTMTGALRNGALTLMVLTPLSKFIVNMLACVKRFCLYTSNAWLYCWPHMSRGSLLTCGLMSIILLPLTSSAIG